MSSTVNRVRFLRGSFLKQDHPLFPFTGCLPDLLHSPTSVESYLFHGHLFRISLLCTLRCMRIALHLFACIDGGTLLTRYSVGNRSRCTVPETTENERSHRYYLELICFHRVSIFFLVTAAQRSKCTLLAIAEPCPIAYFSRWMDFLWSGCICSCLSMHTTLLGCAVLRTVTQQTPRPAHIKLVCSQSASRLVPVRGTVGWFV